MNITHRDQSLTSGDCSDVFDKIPVYYCDAMVANVAGFSPSSGKPRNAIESWTTLGFPFDLLAPPPCSVQQLSAAHDTRMITEVLACQRRNGFGNSSPAVAKSLPYTCGAMLAAARTARFNRRVAVAPVSGFHHAGFDRCGGYCTFNGLMVTAIALLEEGVKKIGIVDFDIHYGDGTDDIIDRLQLESLVTHISPSKLLKEEGAGDEFLSLVPEWCGSLADCGVVLYQAGADPHVDDPLGGWLTTEELRDRDRLVFETFARLKVPVAWNLAGGYQRDEAGSIRPVLDIHDNTFRECAKVFLKGSG